jgi:hypothetical protein
LAGLVEREMADLVCHGDGFELDIEAVIDGELQWDGLIEVKLMVSW